MDYRVELTGAAEGDLERIIQHIAEQDLPSRALHVLDALESRIDGLATEPNRGSYPKELAALGIRDFREVFFKLPIGGLLAASRSVGSHFVNALPSQSPRLGIRRPPFSTRAPAQPRRPRVNPLDHLHPEYLTDAHGHRKAVVLPIDEFDDLLSDLADLAMVPERRDEPTVSHESLREELRREGLLAD